MNGSSDRLRIAVLISGGGRTLANLMALEEAGLLPVRIVLVVSSRQESPGLERARAVRIPTRVIQRRGLAPGQFDEQVTAAVDEARAGLVCMAGWLCPWHILPRYEHRVMNIHPALLPRFGGRGFWGHHVHEAVLASGERESGCTVHFANNEYDAGPIILQRRVPVWPDDTPDTLAARVFEQECIAYPEAIRLFAEGRLRVHDGRVEMR